MGDHSKLDTQESLLKGLFARQALTIQLLRLLLRERASQNGQTEDDIMAWAEEIKSFFEQRMQLGSAESHMTSAINAFFNALADEVRSDREARGN